MKQISIFACGFLLTVCVNCCPPGTTAQNNHKELGRENKDTQKENGVPEQNESNGQTEQNITSQEGGAAICVPSDELPTTCKINKEGNTIATRYTNTDPRYERRATNDYGTWLLNRELHPVGHVTHYYNGKTKYVNCQVGVLTYDFIGENLQQCADACIRLRAEYLWEKKMYDKIHFKNTPGFNFEYRKWAEGYRVHFDKNWKASWSKDAQPDYSYSNFKKYLFTVFTYCGTLSLSKEMRPVHISKAQPGDLVLYGGSPGHAVTIMDILHEKNGKKIKLMFSQSYMPAQEIEILANRYENNSPWFELEDLDDPNLMIDTPEWTFTGNKVMRWADL